MPWVVILLSLLPRKLHHNFCTPPMVAEPLLDDTNFPRMLPNLSHHQRCEIQHGKTIDPSICLELHYRTTSHLNLGHYAEHPARCFIQHHGNILPRSPGLHPLEPFPENPCIPIELEYWSHCSTQVFFEVVGVSYALAFLVRMTEVKHRSLFMPCVA